MNILKVKFIIFEIILNFKYAKPSRKNLLTKPLVISVKNIFESLFLTSHLIL